jgi:hopanoid biosynthesis associated protein HpnK
MAIRLIINADDFGASESVNEAIVHLYDTGIVTSTSLLVGGPAAEHAVALARERPGLPIGLHLAVTHGRPVSGAEQISHLVEGDGRFSEDCVRTALKVTLLPTARRQLHEELAAQFRRFEEWGLPWSHVDFHVHMGLTPAVRRAGLALCRNRARRIRVPEDDAALHARLVPEEAAWARRESLPFRLQCPAMRKEAKRQGLHCAKTCFGYFKTGRLDLEYLVKLVTSLPEGDLELHCHPDFGTPAGRTEIEALASSEFRAALAAKGVCLVPGFDPL